MFIKNLNPLRVWGRGGDTRTHLGWGLGSIIHPRRGTGRETGLYQGIGFEDGVGKNRPRSAPLPCLMNKSKEIPLHVIINHALIHMNIVTHISLSKSIDIIPIS